MMRSMPSSQRPITLTVLGPVLAALVSILAACSQPADDEGQETTTTEAQTEQSGTTGVAESATTTEADPVVENLSDVSWVVNDRDGLVDDQGRVLKAIEGTPIGGNRTVARAGDGSVFFVMDRSLWQWPLDASKPIEVGTETDEVLGLGYDGADLVINPDGEPEVVADGGNRQRPEREELDESGDVITATNGITVRVLEAEADVDSGGYVSNLRSPAQLEVERDGSIEWTVAAGGVAAPWLSLVDFDGRYVMMVRAPTEPADPMMQHIVYDLNCQSDTVAGRGCTRTFRARSGTATLVGPDVSRPDLDPQLLDVCPTMRTEILPPTEMTDPEVFAISQASRFTAEDVAAFERAVLQLATCDPLGMGDPEQEGLAYNPEDPGSGWLWTELADALAGPFTATADGEGTWNRGDDHPTVVLTGMAASGSSEPSIRFEPTNRPPVGDLAVTVTDSAVALTGSADETVAQAAANAAEAMAEGRNVVFTDMVAINGPPTDAVDRFVEAIDAFGDADDDTIGEVLLVDDQVVVRTYNRSDATAIERQLGFAFADFANGGEGAFNDLPFADEVTLVFGSKAYARRDSAVLFQRLAWEISAADFADYSGPFNLIDFVPSPSQVVVGPHARCASAIPIPAPPELADYRRVGILPDEGSVDSCVNWSAIDLFVDDDGLIRGVGLDLVGP